MWKMNVRVCKMAEISDGRPPFKAGLVRVTLSLIKRDRLGWLKRASIRV